MKTDTPIDEDYKIAEWHAFDLDEMTRLLEAIRACERQAERVLAGAGKGPGRQGSDRVAREESAERT